jgi:FixJ family two-component response regulator
MTDEPTVFVINADEQARHALSALLSAVGLPVRPYTSPRTTS